MLTQIQKKLKHSNCPSCGKINVLEAVLICSTDEKRCNPICQCIECGLSLIVQIPEGVSLISDNDSLSIDCDLETTSCNIEIIKVA